MNTTVKQRAARLIARHCAALIAGVVLAMPAMAQSASAGAPQRSDNWSEFGLAGGEAGNATPCLSAVCAVGKAIRPEPLQENRAVAVQASPSAALEWRQHGRFRDGAEAYNCALSLAVGGELASDGYLGAQLFGRAQTLHLPGAKRAP